MRYIFLLLVALTLPGCASMLNGGYATDFTECPKNNVGQCMSVEEATENAAIQAQAAKNKPYENEYTAKAYLAKYKIDTELEKQPPFALLVSELQSCIDLKNKECIKTKLEEIEAYSKLAGDRALAREAFKRDQEEEFAKMMSLRNVAQRGSLPMRTAEKMMEFTLLPYETTTGVLASERKYWVIVHPSEWVWDKMQKTTAPGIGGVKQVER